MSHFEEADRELSRWSRRLVVPGLVGFVLGLLLDWRWLTTAAALVLLAGGVINLVRFLPIRPFWK